ncbi:hypothetical protein ACFL22_00815 [Patescibacteria group bacterium]
MIYNHTRNEIHSYLGELKMARTTVNFRVLFKLEDTEKRGLAVDYLSLLGSVLSNRTFEEYAAYEEKETILQICKVIAAKGFGKGYLGPKVDLCRLVNVTDPEKRKVYGEILIALSEQLADVTHEEVTPEHIGAIKIICETLANY